MTHKHTPGPWTVKLGKYGAPHSVSFAPKSYGVIARVLTPGAQNLPEAPGNDECEASARLIAAAPELLEALERIESQTHCEYARDEARAALASAKGEG